MSRAYNSAYANKIGIGLIVLILLVYVGLNIEAYEEEVFTGAEAQAYQAPFLAMQRHLAQYDVSLTIQEDVAGLFDSDDSSPQMTKKESALNKTLINKTVNSVAKDKAWVLLSESEVSITQAQATQLLDFAQNGGHIVAAMSVSSDELGDSTFANNAFLKAIGISSAKVETELAADESQFSQYYAPTLISTQLYGELKVSLSKSSKLRFDNELQLLNSASDDSEIRFLQFKYGKGLISIVTSSALWTNFQIEDSDNVLWLHALLGDATSAFVVTFVRPKMWHELINQYSPSFYTIFFTLILLAAWHVGVRFGNVKTITTSYQAFFSQHIRAAGEFYWRHNQQKVLLTSVRAHLLEELNLRLGPRSSGADKHEKQVQMLCEISQWPKAQIYALLFSKHRLSEAEFIKTIQGLQQLRKMI